MTLALEYVHVIGTFGPSRDRTRRIASLLKASAKVCNLDRRQMMQYEQVKGALGVAALLRRIADGVSTGEVEIDGVTIASLPTVEATVCVEEGPGENLAAVVLRLTRFRHTDGTSAVERELAHPGD
jgi:hypothetical protein